MSYKYNPRGEGKSDGRWLIVIGGSDSQFPYIGSARDLGLNTLVFDRDPAAVGGEIAHHHEVCSTHDAGEILRRCEELLDPGQVAGCMTSSSHQKALASTAAVVEHYGLRGISRETVRRTTDKDLWKELLRDADIPTPRWERVERGGELGKLLDQEEALILKPASGGVGSAGVSLVRKGDPEAERLLWEACEASSDHSALAERWVEGPEYSVDGYVSRGNCRVAGISRKYVRGADENFVIEGYAMGALDRDTERLLKKTAVRVCRALEIDHSFFSLDVKVSGHTAWVVDLGPLLDAKMDRLLWYAGRSVYELGVRLALRGEHEWPVEDGDAPPFNGFDRPEAWSKVAMPSPQTLSFSGGKALRFLYAEREGKLRDDGPLSFLKKVDSVHELPFTFELEKEEGETVRPPRSVADTVGWLMHHSVPAEKVWARIQAIDAEELFSVL
ncbi:MAG: ATP-grasp domain-containing protein [Balneolaceae bacterium]|nr:ATP-grasp domain-containing protein [Balneolaceae bacterium]